MTVRTASVSTVASRATTIALAAGGYVAGENARSGAAAAREHSSVNLTLKVPATDYQSALTALSKLGDVLSMTEQTRDVTQQVADVSSRVASAQAAIGQLRSLLAKAGTINSLLSVQNELNQQEASLEEFQAQARALAHETTFATISLSVVGAPKAATHHEAGHHTGFIVGLTSGWRGLRVVVTALLTALGAVLPFAVPLALLSLAGYRARRWLSRRHPATQGPGAAS